MGFLYQAFEKGYAASCEAMEFSGPALLFCNEENLAFRVDKCESMLPLPKKCVLAAEDLAWTMAAGKQCEIYFAQEVSRR